MRCGGQVTKIATPERICLRHAVRAHKQINVANVYGALRFSALKDFGKHARSLPLPAICLILLRPGKSTACFHCAGAPIA
jgi:hypothetical protein